MRKPAHNGEALTDCLAQGRDVRRWVMPWEALCPYGYGPVTTEPKGEASIAVSSESHPDS